MGAATLSGHIPAFANQRHDTPERQPRADKSRSSADNSAQFVYTDHLRHRGGGRHVDPGGTRVLLSSVYRTGACA